MRIVLIGDIHAYSLLTWPWNLFGKRLLGQANLFARRYRKFNLNLLPPLIEKVTELNPSTILFTGDLTTTSLAPEFKQVRDAIAPAVAHTQTVIVPGNHDRYTFTSNRVKRMENIIGGLVPNAFPHSASLTCKWQLIALNSGSPNIISSRGRLGEQQLSRLKQLLQTIPPDTGLVILNHYPILAPPDTPQPWSRQFEEAEQLRKLIADFQGQVIYVHGHIHKPWAYKPDDISNMLDINTGAPCMTTSQYPQGQGFWELNLPQSTDQQINLIHWTQADNNWHSTEHHK